LKQGGVKPNCRLVTLLSTTKEPNNRVYNAGRIIFITERTGAGTEKQSPAFAELFSYQSNQFIGGKRFFDHRPRICPLPVVQ